jgi:nucleoside-diphosphate-sugar epimerase
MSDELIVVAGGGGFIGGHLVASLLEGGHRVRAVDIKPLEQWHQIFPEAENLVLPLSQPDACAQAVAGGTSVYNLAADMGGMGFIEANKARCMLSVLINTNLLLAARQEPVERYFFSSSACVYAAGKQLSSDVRPLKESDAYPADAEDGYGWEKLFSERMCRHFREDFGLTTRVARYHNVYGPYGTWTGGREKAPAAICRKVAEAKLSGRHEIEVWGDGEQTRSFMYVDDCIEGTLKIMASDVEEPINLGSSELVTINQLVDIVEEIAGVEVARRYNLDAPKGVRGRNSDNTLILERLGWEPSTSLRSGLEHTYHWIYDQLSAQRAVVGVGALPRSPLKRRVRATAQKRRVTPGNGAGVLRVPQASRSGSAASGVERTH